MPDFLLELLSEEVPARMQAKASADLARLFGEKIGEAGLAAEAVETFATPRRLALIARGLPGATEAVSEEIKGPRASAPPQALEGFLRKTGLQRDQLVEREGVLFAIIDRPGRPASNVLAEAVPLIVRAFPWPKSMRWGAASVSTESLRWVRPLHGIVALLGEEIVPFEIAGVKSGAATVGHRFHHPGAITIGSVGDYAEKLRACRVILDPAERRAVIAQGAARLADEAGLALVEDEGLLAENVGLTEWPVPLLGNFDPDFLDVPAEVIRLTMRTNQKYFALADKGRKLAPNFICVANIEAADGGGAIAEGNRKVLAARLADARYFWEQDLKVPLEEQAQKLSQIVFHERLGTLADKVERVAMMASSFIAHVISPFRDDDKDRQSDEALRAGRLAKSDLVSSMVGEFPELQGVIGSYYAAAQGEGEEVARAIRDQYKPAGQTDELPCGNVAVALSLADKYDTIAAFFLGDMAPSGSRDPFGLRRAALGIIRIITANGLRFGMTAPVAVLADTLAMQLISGKSDIHDAAEAVRQPLKEIGLGRSSLQTSLDRLGAARGRGYATDGSELIQSVRSFFIDRLKVQQREAGVRHDLIDAVFALGGEDDLVRLLARVKALQAFVATEEGADLLAGYKRAANILKKEEWSGGTGGGRLTYEPLPAEAVLITALDLAEPRAAAAVAAEDFEGAMAALASLRAPVDAFFDEVTVNDADPVKRAARLDLLMRMRDAVHRVADFSRIEG